VDGSCVTPDYNGLWLLSANPNQKPCGLLGNTTFADQIIALTVNGTQAKGVISQGSFTVNYEGTLKGKHLKMTANYVQSMSVFGLTINISHYEILDVNFVSPNKFTGVDEDQVSGDLLNCTLYWSVTGLRQ